MGQIDEVLDSNIVIDALNGTQEALAVLQSGKRQGISVIVWIEVMAGAGPLDEARYQTFLSGFTILELTPAIALGAARLRKSSRLKLPDAIILATARELRAPLLTRNTRDFPADMLGIMVPY